MKIRLINLLLIGSIVSSVMLSSCNTDSSTTVETEAFVDSEDNNLSATEKTGTFIDSRDNKVYKWVRIGNQVWMAENLAYTGNDIRNVTNNNDWESNSDYDGWCYHKNNEASGDIYGVLYQWEAAKTACPSGWRLPTTSEWIELKLYLETNEGSKLADNAELWEDDSLDQSTDFGTSGFSALPAGGRDLFGNFLILGYNGQWWLAPESNSGSAYHFVLTSDVTNMFKRNGSKMSGYSVRCIRDN